MRTEDETAGLDAARRMFEADEASAGLGIELVELAPGRAAARMRVTASMLNGHAIGHGGYVFLLADTAFALACNSHGPATVAAGADVSFLAPIREGDVLTARAQERARYGRSGIYDVTVTRESSAVTRDDSSDNADDAGINSATAGVDVDADAGPASEAEQVVAEFRGRSRTLTRR